MNWDDLRKEKKEELDRTNREFGIPDRLILDTDIKFWRFKGHVTEVSRGDSISYSDVIPVYSGEQIIGAASILPVNGAMAFDLTSASLLASVTATHDLPERLDYENGQHFRLIPELTNGENRRLHIKALHLRRSRGIEDFNFEIEEDVWEIG